jgi:hypothetical protein
MFTFILDLFMPTGSGKLAERTYEHATRGSLAFESRRPGAIKRALNDSDWLDDEVVAAGQLRQGRAPSLIAIVTGLALIELARPRPSKSLPRQFVLAVTFDRVVAFKASGGGDSESNYELRIKAGELGSWPRDLVRLADPRTLDLAGERIPVARANLNGDSSTDELIALLGN